MSCSSAPSNRAPAYACWPRAHARRRARHGLMVWRSAPHPAERPTAFAHLVLAAAAPVLLGTVRHGIHLDAERLRVPFDVDCDGDHRDAPRGLGARDLGVRPVSTPRVEPRQLAGLALPAGAHAAVGPARELALAAPEAVLRAAAARCRRAPRAVDRHDPAVGSVARGDRGDDLRPAADVHQLASIGAPPRRGRRRGAGAPQPPEPPRDRDHARARPRRRDLRRRIRLALRRPAPTMASVVCRCSSSPC
jgi:hypothetical protein